MPSTDRRCTFCSDLIKGNNMARHLQRFHKDQYENNAAESLCHDVSMSRDSSLSAEKATTLHVQTNSGHVSRREQYENSLGQSPPVSSDDVRSAAHCMLSFTDGLNILSLSNYLKTFYTSIPEVRRVPVIVATFAAAQKVAAHHMDVPTKHSPDGLTGSALWSLIIIRSRYNVSQWNLCLGEIYTQLRRISFSIGKCQFH